MNIPKLKQMLDKSNDDLEFVRKMINSFIDSMKDTNKQYKDMLDMISDSQITPEKIIHPEKRGIKDSIEMGD